VFKVPTTVAPAGTFGIAKTVGETFDAASLPAATILLPTLTPLTVQRRPPSCANADALTPPMTTV
jgi:hypothetical protein